MSIKHTPAPTKRYTILFDTEVYRAGIKVCKDRRLKIFEYLNMLVSADTGVPITADLKHRSKDTTK